MSEIKSGIKVEKEVPNPMQDNAKEVATDSQDQQAQPSPEVGDLIAESKKYRSRAQTAEDQLSKLQKQLEADKETQMAEQNKWQELAEQRGSKIQEQEPIIEAAMKQLESMREEILADMSEEDRETFGDLPLDKLKAIHSKINIQTKAEVAPTDGTPARTANPNNKSWVEMSSEERRSNWGSILDAYRRR
ncbi:Ankyrin repeat protein [uncultured Mediterranean phage uvMED]|nr:Ankyrin repeat protein [uncultured Mediterranean phage uvMED]